MRPISATERTRGPKLPSLKKTPKVGAIQEFSVHLVDWSVPLPRRLTLARVAFVAQSSTPQFKTGYDGTVDNDDQRLYVLRQDTRAIAFALTALADRFWQLEWTEGGSPRLRSRNALIERRPTVGRVWVASDYQRKGLGAALVVCALSHLSVAPSEAGWTYPLTSAGNALVRRLCPGNFLVCCDPVELQPLLSAESAA